MPHTYAQIRSALRSAKVQGWVALEGYSSGKRKGPTILRKDGLKIRVAYQDVAVGPAPGIQNNLRLDWGLNLSPLDPNVVTPPEPVIVPVGCYVLFNQKWTCVEMDLPVEGVEFPVDVLRQVDEMFPCGKEETWGYSQAVQVNPTRMGLLMDSDEDPATSRLMRLLLEDND